MREYEIVKGFNENLKNYPEYIKTIMGDLNDYVNTLGTRVVDMDYLLDGTVDHGNETNKFIVEDFYKFLSKEIDDTDICITTIIEPNPNTANLTLSMERQLEILNLLGFVDVNLRFGSKKRIMLYIRNNAGMEYYNAIRYIVFTFLDNYDKIGVKK